MQTREGRLPDLEALSRCVRAVGNPFSVRGVEATVEGWLVRDGKRWLLRLPGSREALRLAPLSRMVQWNPQTRRAPSPTHQEKYAYKSLAAKWTGQPRRIQITGPLLPAGKNDLPVLEVRQLHWEPRAPPAPPAGSPTK